MSTDADLPALPEPAQTSFVTDSVMRRLEVHSFSATQMHNYARAAIEADRARAQPAPSVAVPEVWQGGLSNDELRAALESKLRRGATYSDRDLTPFALGVEWALSNFAQRGEPIAFLFVDGRGRQTMPLDLKVWESLPHGTKFYAASSQPPT